MPQGKPLNDISAARMLFIFSSSRLNEGRHSLCCPFGIMNIHVFKFPVSKRWNDVQYQSASCRNVSTYHLCITMYVSVPCPSQRVFSITPLNTDPLPEFAVPKNVTWTWLSHPAVKGKPCVKTERTDLALWKRSQRTEETLCNRLSSMVFIPVLKSFLPNRCSKESGFLHLFFFFFWAIMMWGKTQKQGGLEVI